MRIVWTPLVTSEFCSTSDQSWRGCGLVGHHTYFGTVQNYPDIGRTYKIKLRKCVDMEPSLETSYYLLGIISGSSFFNCKKDNHNLLYEAIAPHSNTMEGES